MLKLKIAEKYYLILKTKKNGRDRRIQQKREARERRNGIGTQQGRVTRLRRMDKETRLDCHLKAHSSHCFAAQLCPVTKSKWWLINSHKPDSFYSSKSSEILVSACKWKQAVSWELDTIFLLMSKVVAAKSWQMGFMKCVHSFCTAFNSRKIRRQAIHTCCLTE